MPPVVAAAAAAVAGMTTAQLVVAAIAVVAAAYSFTAMQKAKKMNQGASSTSERKQTFRSSNAPKQVVLGEVEVSGPLIYAMEKGAPNDSGEGELVDIVVPLAGHNCHDCINVRMGDQSFRKESSFADGSYWTLRKGGITHGEIWYYSRPATVTSPPPSIKSASQWDNDMIGCCQTFLHARLRSGQDQWPAGIEDIVAKVRGAEMLDPRTGKTGWSSNPVVQGMHYIRHFLLAPENHILKDAMIEAANICDEPVTRGGITEPRYSCHAVFDEETDPKDVLGMISACMAGEFIRSGGLWGAWAGAYYGPATRTLSTSEVVGSLDIRVSLPLDERVNTVTGQYMERDQGYNLTDFPAISRSEYVEEDGRERVEDLKFDFVQSVTQAQALGWIELEKRRRGATVIGRFKPSAIDAVITRVVKNDFPGVSGLEFRVTRWKPALGGDIYLELQEDHPDIWSGQPARIVKPVLPGLLPGRDPRNVQPVANIQFTRTPDNLNQHGVLSWEGRAASYDIYLLDGDKIIWKDDTTANLIPLTLPVADKLYTIEIVALNSFKVKSPAVSKPISLTLAAPVVSATQVNTHDHWLEVSWSNSGAESYELELMTGTGKGVYRTHVNGAPVRLGWFNPGDYRLRVRALLGITPSAWSDDVVLQIDDLNGPLPVFMPESKDTRSSGGMLSFSRKDPRTERIEFECSGPGFHQSGDCPGTPVRLSSMLPAVYQFRARAQWRDVYSGWQTMTQRLSENLTTPVNLRFTDGDDPGLWGLLTWEANAEQYRITITRMSDKSTPIQTQVTGTQYQVPVLKVGDYQVEIIGLGRVEESQPASISLTLAAPDAPVNVTFQSFDNDATHAGKVFWDAVASSSGYQVRLCKGGDILVESKTTDNRWLIAPLTPDDYEVQVATISQREGALSEWSSVAFTLSGLTTPQGLAVQETLIGSGIQIISQVILRCNPVAGATHYEFEYQELGQGSWSGIQSGPAISATLNAIPPGNYTFRVRAISGARRSGYATKSFGVLGTERPPQSLQNLRLHGYNGNKAILSWDLSPDPDVLTGGSIHVRHTHLKGEAANWAAAPEVSSRLPGNATQAEVSLREGTYLVKPVNAAGFHSEQAAVVVSNMAGQIGYNRVLERVEPTSWPGVKNKATVEVGGSLTLAEGNLSEGYTLNFDGGASAVDIDEFMPSGDFEVRIVFKVHKPHSNEAGSNRWPYCLLSGSHLGGRSFNLYVVDLAGAGNRYALHFSAAMSGGSFPGIFGDFGADEWLDVRLISRDGKYQALINDVSYQNASGVLRFRGPLQKIGRDYRQYFEGELRLVELTDYQSTNLSRRYHNLVTGHRPTLPILKDELGDGSTDARLSGFIPDDWMVTQYKSDQLPSYIMNEPVDLGAVVTAQVTMDVDSTVYFADTIDERTTPIDSWVAFDGETPDEVSLRYELSQTDDDPNSPSANWSDWTPFIKGEFRGRGYKLRIIMQGNAAGAAATLTGLKLIVDVQDRTEKDSNLNAPASGLRVNYKTAFLDTSPSIAITAHALPEKGRWVLSEQDNQGFNIRFYNGSTAIAARFDYQAIGYGEAQ